MPETRTPPRPLPTLGRNVLRIVLFGLPDAGKSSLLGALAQAAQTQEHLLNGHLTDLTRGLAELQKRLYEEHPRETLQEVVPYEVIFEPFVAPGQGNAGARIEAVLVDCDGRVANELLSRRQFLDAQSNERSLARAILEADALLLVVDAAASATQVEADFKEFGRFLRLLEQSRGRRSDVGGLPAVLVLAKCDLLAQPTDAPAAWIERIEERKRQLNDHFQDFLTRQKAEAPLRFGRIDLHLWATAVKRPALVGTPAKPREPYGVAELFRESFAYARAFQKRRAQSSRRLLWTVAGCTGLVAAMITLVASLLFYRPHEQPGTRELLSTIDSYRARDPQTPSTRLREPLQRKISELTDLVNDPNFDQLPEDKREFVQTRLQELQEYQAYKMAFDRLAPLDTLRSDRELDAIEKRLVNLTPPGDHKSQWSQTEVALERGQRLEDVKKLRAAIADMEDWYSGLESRGQDLWTFSGRNQDAPVSWRDWQSQVQELLAESEHQRHHATDRLPESALTYETVLRFDRVAEHRKSWERLRQRLERVRDLSTALGLTGALPDRSPLDIPANFAVAQAGVRLQELENAYPRYAKQFTVAELPDAIAGEIRRAARTRYEHALKAGREVVLRHLQEVSPGAEETPESWRRLRSWLRAPEDLKAWRVLAKVLARLQNADALDPVDVLEAFVRKESFELVLQRLVLHVPDNLNVRPEAKLAVHHQAGETSKVLNFELSGEQRHDVRRRVTTYGFRPSGADTISYRLGDTLWADVACKRADNPDWMLTWARNRSAVYQFERLVRPPRLHQKNQANTEGEVEEAVSLEVIPEVDFPKVPDLVPIVPTKLKSD